MKIKKLRKRNSWFGGTVIVSCVLLLLLTAFFYLRKGPANTNVFNASSLVRIQQDNGHYSLYKNGQPFIIKGGAGYTFLNELQANGGNTIICWDTTVLGDVLNQATQHHLMVIAGIDIPGVQYFDAYKNKGKVDSLFAASTNLVRKYRDHPALLAWCLGNELKFPNSIEYDQFYYHYNRLLGMVHSNDPNHPVCTTVINVAKNNIFNIQWRIPALDFIGLNIYNSIRTIEEDLNYIKLFWNGPYFVSEWAPRGGWEVPVTSWMAPIENNSTDNAQEYYDFFVKYMPVRDGRFLGSMVFYWGTRQEYTHTFYSIFNEEGKPTEIKEALFDCWNDTLTKHQSPRVADMRIDNNLAPKDNIILNAGSLHSATIAVKYSHPVDSLQYHWEIVKEDWSSWGKIWIHFKKPAAEKALLADSSRQQVNFEAPRREGPYRIFVTVTNEYGYCANANIPFYVIE